MTGFFSIYLEVARVIATLLVFFAHGFMFYPPLDEFNQVAKLGRDGVIIFFVLSGFVITWCANEREKTFFDFAVNRASRIYSVAIPGIALGFFVSFFVSINEGKELLYPFYKPWIYIPIYLSFVGNFWGLNEAPPANFPYWSLNYEVWYYLIFAAFYYVRNKVKWILISGMMLLVGPSILQLFPLWVMGSMLYFLGNKIKLSQFFARLVLVLSFFLFILIKWTGFDNYLDQYNSDIWSLIFNAKNYPPQLLGDYLLAVVVAINFFSAMHCGLNFDKTVEKIIKKAASFSFSFYLFHIPIFTLLRSVFSWQEDSLAVYFLMMIGSGMIIMFLAKYTEHKKQFYRSLFYSFVGSIKSRVT